MPILTEFHKPADLPAALALLKRKTPRTVPLAGGTWLNPRLGQAVSADAVVDLSKLGLNKIELNTNTLRLGAMATLADVMQDETCRLLANGVLAQTAQQDATVNVRNAATVGGTIVVAPVDSEFILAMLALAAEAVTHSEEMVITIPLFQLVADPAAAIEDGLVTQVKIALSQRVAGGLARVARTPADHPIVAAVAVVAENPGIVRIAIGGASNKHLLVEAAQAETAKESVAQAIAAAGPCADFRGSAEYRREMGAMMAQRALAQAIENAGGAA